MRYIIYNDTGVCVKSPSRHFRTVALARQWGRDHKGNLDLGQAVQMVPQPLSEVFDEFLIGTTLLADGTIRVGRSSSSVKKSEMGGRSTVRRITEI